MFEELKIPRNRRWTLFFLSFCCLFTIVAMFLGSYQNPTGRILIFNASILFFLAFVHPWRTPIKFGILIFLTFVCYYIFKTIHDFYMAAIFSGRYPDGNFLLTDVMSYFSYVAIFFWLPGLLVGVIGIITIFIRNHIKPVSS
jgi:hypothetical protein